MLLSLKAADFINRAQTKVRQLAAYLSDNYDYNKNYQSEDVEKVLVQIYEFRQLIKMLLRTNYGEMSEKDVSDTIDFFSYWGELHDINAVTYSTYQSIIEGPVIVESGAYALQVDLVTEINNRIAGDNALSARVTVLEHNQIDPSTIFPPHFFDKQVASNVNVWDDDTRLHTHANESILDQLDSTMLANIEALVAHYASIGNPSGVHVSSGDRTYWNAKVDPSVISGLSTVYAPISHVQSGPDKHTIDQITNLQATIDALNAAIASMAGHDGREVELQRSGDNIQWRYVGDPTWTDLGNFKGNTGDQGAPFTIDARGLDTDRLNVIYNSETDQFTFLALDTGYLYYRNPSGGPATASAGWTNPLLFLGQDGWSPVLAVYQVSPVKAVFQLIDWVGGTGSKPVLDPGPNPPTPVQWFIGAGGLTLDVTQAINIMGPQGAQGHGPQIGATGNLAGRSVYDNSPQAFIYLRTDVSPNIIYIKNTDSNADWSAALPWQGPPGPNGSGAFNVAVDPTGAPIVFDFGLKNDVYFTGAGGAAASIGAAKTWSFINVTNAMRFEFLFNMTTTNDQTMPTNLSMPSANGQWQISTSHVWTPPMVGKYIAKGVYDKSADYWYMDIIGPF